ncbi:MAG: hypothetical protein R2788_20785 [Saprospiraceae bacterium]
MKLSNYFLNILFLLFLLNFFSCQKIEPLYKKEWTEQEKKELPKKLVNGISNYYQGTPAQQFLLQEALFFDSTYADIYREIGVPYLKRGIAAEFSNYYGKAADLNPLDWLAWRGYLYLFFYRDYDRALNDFLKADDLTPGIVDHPQSMNIDFLKGVCYLKLGQYQKAIDYFDTQIKYETETVGLEYMESITFLFKGIAFWEMSQFKKAYETFTIGLSIDAKNSDLLFWTAKYWQQMGNNSKAKEFNTMAKEQFLNGYFNKRNYVEEFFQTYLSDIEGLEKELDLKNK